MKSLEGKLSPSPWMSEDAYDLLQKVRPHRLQSTRVDVRCMILDQLLEPDPNQRACSSDVLKAHPFFKRIDWQLLANGQLSPPSLPHP